MNGDSNTQITKLENGVTRLYMEWILLKSAFFMQLSNADARFSRRILGSQMGTYLSLPSVHNYKNYTSWPDMVITTGQAVNLQIPADRNPTSWTASGLASGLSINNSGIISGSVSSLSAFSTTVTASNADGNDSKSISFGVSKGNRVIDWNQTFGGIATGMPHFP